MELPQDDRRVLLLGLLAAVLMGSIVYSFMLPRLAVGNVLRNTEVTGYSVFQRDVEHRQTTLIVNVVVGNPSAIPITVTNISAKVLVDGRDYGSLSTSGTTGTVAPHMSSLYQKFVQIRGSPLSREEIPQESYDLRIIVELTCMGRTPLSRSVRTGEVILYTTWPQTS